MSEKIHRASHQGVLSVGGLQIPCFVLDDGTRLITQRGMQTTIGMSTSGGSGGAHRTAQIIQRMEDKLHIDNDLSVRMRNPIIFHPPKGGKIAYGYEGTILIDVCELILKARDQDLLLPAQEQYADAADMVIRSFAKVGIIAVIDEVTGYQEIRDKEALQQILDRYLRQEFAAWAKRFPDEFYREMFRLRGWYWRGMRVNRPSVVGKYTNDLVYQRIAPGVLDELQRRNTKDEKGNREGRHHQLLTDDIGIPALQQHLFATVGFMRASSTWDQFYRMMQRAFPKLNSTLFLNFPDPDAEAEA